MDQYVGAMTNMDRFIPQVDDLIGQTVEQWSKFPISQMVLEHFSAGGKRIRARLTLQAVEALGGETEKAIPVAAACETLHNATLVHDDIQDGDKLRRGQSTVWAKHGVNQAINVGDLLFMLPFSILNKSQLPSETKWQLSAALAETAQKVILGQSLEPGLKLNLDSNTLLSAYLQCIRGKTAALLSFPIIAACILTKQNDDLKSLELVFEKLGMIFQIQDDILDLYGEKGRGRRGEDLREGKVSVLAVHHLMLKKDAELLELLNTPRGEVADASVEYWVVKFKNSGALEKSLLLINQFETEIFNSEALTKYSKVKELVDHYLKTILGPISHLL